MKASSLTLDIALSDKQLEFEASLRENRLTGYGGAKGGGKSGGARRVGIIDCLETPGLVAALFRKSYPELQDNHLGPLFREYPQLRAFYNSSRHELRFPSLESEFKFRYCQSLADVDRQAGREYHRLMIEEAGDWTYDMAMRLLRNTNRSSRPGIKPSAGMLFNWGGVGHAWLKRLFYDRNLTPEERNLLPIHFIPARLEDNPALMENNPEYARTLESEPNEALRKAYRYGDPNIVAGQYFTELSSEIHFIEPFQIPDHWPRFGGYDYGFNHPCSVGWYAADGDGNVYKYRELVRAGLDIPDVAEMMKQEASTKRISVWEAGHDCWAKKSGNDPTIAEKFAKLGIYLKRANIDRKQGAAHLRGYLRHRMVPVTDREGKVVLENGEPKLRRDGPRLSFFKTCPVSFHQVAAMVHDPDDVEDVLKVDASAGDPLSGDDAYDETRMALMSRPPIAIAPKKPQSDRYTRRRGLGDELPWTVR